jgi:hypothetical protein
MLDEHDEKHQSIVLTDSIHASQESMLIFDPGGFISFLKKKKRKCNWPALSIIKKMGCASTGFMLKVHLRSGEQGTKRDELPRK